MVFTRSTPTADLSRFERRAGAGITVVPTDGSIWGAATAATRSSASSHHAVRCTAPTPPGSGSNPHGIASTDPALGPDALREWLGQRSLPVRLRRDIPRRSRPRFLQLPDMTGAILRTITTREGRWIQDFDSVMPPPTGIESSGTHVACGTGVRAKCARPTRAPRSRPHRCAAPSERLPPARRHLGLPGLAITAGCESR